MRWLCVAHEKEIPDFDALSQGDILTHVLGVGQFQALASFSALLTTSRPDSVILIGTAGSPDSSDVMRIFHCEHFALPKIAEEDFPEFLARCVQTQPAFSHHNLPAATIVQNQGISLNQEKFIANTGYIPMDYPQTYLENMEATSLALFCKSQGIAFSAVVCVTNLIGPNGRADWRKNFREAGTKLRAILKT